MKIITTNMGHKAIIKLTGRFDFSKHHNFKAAYEPLLLQSELKALEIEMDGIHHFDSSALGMLVVLRECAQAVEKTVLLSKPNQFVSQILETANFHELFTILQPSAQD